MRTILKSFRLRKIQHSVSEYFNYLIQTSDFFNFKRNFINMECRIESTDHDVIPMPSLIDHVATVDHNRLEGILINTNDGRGISFPTSMERMRNFLRSFFVKSEPPRFKRDRCLFCNMFGQLLRIFQTIYLLIMICSICLQNFNSLYPHENKFHSSYPVTKRDTSHIFKGNRIRPSIMTFDAFESGFSQESSITFLNLIDHHNIQKFSEDLLCDFSTLKCGKEYILSTFLNDYNYKESKEDCMNKILISGHVADVELPDDVRFNTGIVVGNFSVSYINNKFGNYYFYHDLPPEIVYMISNNDVITKDDFMWWREGFDIKCSTMIFYNVSSIKYIIHSNKPHDYFFCDGPTSKIVFIKFKDNIITEKYFIWWREGFDIRCSTVL